MDFRLADVDLNSRFLLGTAGYPSPQVLRQSVEAAGAEVLTVSLRRQMPGVTAANRFWDMIRATGCRVLPNTAGCRSRKEAILTARMAREVFDTNWIKLEVVGDDYNLQPDPMEIVAAAKALVDDGFEVFPYTTDDLVICQRLADAGCRVIMPWASPIGSGQGILNPHALETLRRRLGDVTLIVDAGIGSPADAVQAMQLGMDAVLLNSAVSQAADPVTMARAFALAIESGRLAFEAGVMQKHARAVASTPVVGTPFWHEEP
ncbi:MAG: thiazole synthase [Proteobacteria bacterium]|nr:MAG: thiazole synthase [Pseudomonadota bacterium]